MIGGMPFLAVGRLELPQIQPLYRPMHEKAKMPFSQHIPHTRRQQIGLLRVVLQKIRHRAASSCAQYTGAVNPRVATQTLKGGATTRKQGKAAGCKPALRKARGLARH